MPAKKINFRGRVGSRDDARSLLSQSGDIALIERGVPRMFVMRCPCGCGDDLIINLDRRSGPAWRFYLKQERVTLYPSYWRDSLCKSHFIVWDSQIYWCSGGTEDEIVSIGPASQEIETKALAALPYDSFVEYNVLADQLDINPWDVLKACRQLENKGHIIRDTNSKRLVYKRVLKTITNADQGKSLLDKIAEWLAKIFDKKK